MWGTIAGIAHVAAVAFGPGFYPSWFFLLTSVAYGLMLPVIAVLHVRHVALRESGAMLGTVAGTSVALVGIAASAAPELAVAALFVRAIWWWTIGKIWWETGVLPRWLGFGAAPTNTLLRRRPLAVRPVASALRVPWQDSQRIST